MMDDLLQQLSAYSAKQRILAISVLLYPVVAITVKSGGSTMFSLLAIWSLFSGWSWWSQLKREEKLLLFGFVLLFLFALFTLLFSENLYTGAKRVERFFRIALILPLFLLLKVQRIDVAKLLLLGVVLAAFVMGGQALYDVLVLGKVRAEGINYAIGFGDVAVLNAALLVVALMTISMSWRERVIILFAVVFALYAVLASQARGGWLFIPFFSLMLVGLYWQRTSFPIRWKVAGVGILLLGGLGMTQLPVVAERIDKAVVELENYNSEVGSYSSARARLKLWQVAISIWRGEPLLGSGVGDFELDKGRLLDAMGMQHEGLQHYGHAHSIYFDALAGMGSLGIVLLFSALFLLPGRYFFIRWRQATEAHERFTILAGLTVVCAFAVFGLTESWLARNMLVTPYVLYLVVLLSAVGRSRGTLEGEPCGVAANAS